MFSRFLILVFTLVSFIGGAITTEALDSDKQKTVCEFISETATNANKNLIFENMERHKSAPFVREYLIQKVASKNKHEAPELAPLKSEPPSDSSIDYYEKYIRWAHDIGYLPYNGHWFAIHSRADSGAVRGAKSTGAFIAAASGRNGPLCVFDSKEVETPISEMVNWHRNAKFEGLDCKAAIEPSKVIRANTQLPEGVEDALIAEMGKDYYEGKFKSNAYSHPPYADGRTLPFSDGPVLKTDINNDGNEDTLVRMIYSESSSSPCNTAYYDLLLDNMTGLGETNLREALLETQGMTLRTDGTRNLSCGRTHTVLSVEGKNYISSKKQLSRHIFAIENNEAVKLCHSKFTVRPVIVYDAYKENEKEPN